MLYPEIPAELYCRPTKNVDIPEECIELTIPQVTQHASPHGKYYGKTGYWVLAPSLVNLAYLGDEGSPKMQEEMADAGLKMWKGPFRKKKRVALRGSHHKDRTRAKQKLQAEGTWKGTFPMELLTQTEADLDRRVHPTTLYRRQIRERYQARR